jgi:hypothetical protein
MMKLWSVVLVAMLAVCPSWMRKPSAWVVANRGPAVQQRHPARRRNAACNARGPAHEPAQPLPSRQRLRAPAALRPRSPGAPCWVAWPPAWAWPGWPARWAWAQASPVPHDRAAGGGRLAVIGMVMRARNGSGAAPVGRFPFAFQGAGAAPLRQRRCRAPTAPTRWATTHRPVLGSAAAWRLTRAQQQGSGW